MISPAVRDVLIPGHWIEAGVLYFNNRGDRPNTVSSANVQGSVPVQWLSSRTGIIF